jgi:hypothetical protein
MIATTAPAFTAAAAAAASRRWDIYGPIHKGLRAGHGQMMDRLGRADFVGEHQSGLLQDLRRHLDLCGKHLAHEEARIHSALEARRAGASAGLEAQHEQHRARFESLASVIGAVEASGADERRTLGRALYLAFTAYVAEDLEHMRGEETEIWPQLCELFTDDELIAIEMDIVAALSPEDNAAFLRLMLAAMNPEERRVLLGSIEARAPREVYAAVLELAAA